MSFKYHQGAFSLSVSHKIRHTHFRQYFHRHVYMIRTISASTICTSLRLHNMLKIFAISCLSSPYIIFLLNFGAKTIWYLQFHVVCDKLFLSIRTISCDCKNGWRTCFYYITGGILHNAKAIPATRRAGGLFVLQSSVFRISEKLLHGEQGHALTKKRFRLNQTETFLVFVNSINAPAYSQ